MKTIGRAMRRLRDQRGMTVAEVVVAAGIVLVGLVALIAAMPLGTSLISEANRKTTATFLAQQRMEQIKNAQWKAGVDTLGGGGSNGSGPVLPQWPDEGYGTIAFPGSAPCSPADRSGGCGFRREVRIADCFVVPAFCGLAAPSAANTLRHVTVTVRFRPLAGTGQASGTEERVQLITLITRR